MTNLKGITQTAKIISLAIILSFGISLVYAWTEPTVAPTGGNSNAPINTGTGIQQIAGTLLFNRSDGVQGLETYGTTLLATNGGFVGIGTPTPTQLLSVGGVIQTFSPMPGGASGIKFANGSIQSSASPFGNISVYNANSTFVVPSGVTRLWVEVYGGGGSGVGTLYGPGDSGGAGGVAMGFVNVTSGQSIPVTVGAGGIGVIDAGNSCFHGNNGGTSSFGAFLSATGGRKGKGACTGSGMNRAGGGAGGVGTGGIFNQRGGAGIGGGITGDVIGGSNNRSSGGAYSNIAASPDANGSSFGGGGGPSGHGGVGGVVVWY